MTAAVSRRSVRVGVLLTGALVVGATFAHRHPSRPGSTWTTTAAMARAAGCADTFEHVTAFVGVSDAGRCRVGQSWVDFRVLPSSAAALAWSDGARTGRTPQPFQVVGGRWVAFTTDQGAAQQVSRALTAQHV